MKRYIRKFIRKQNSIETARFPLWKLILLIVLLCGLCVYLTMRYTGRTMFTVVQKVETPLATCEIDNFSEGVRVRRDKEDYIITDFNEYKSIGKFSAFFSKVAN